MRTIAICWELGGNYGHIAGLLGLVKEFRKNGCELILILRDLKNKGLLDNDLLVLQAPIPTIKLTVQEGSSFGDILAGIGYLDSNILAPYVEDWRALFDQYEVDLVLAEHAPTALIAAYTKGLPAAALGSGFIIPPVVNGSFPPFDEQLQTNVAQERQIVENINGVLRKFKVAEFQTIGELFGRAYSILRTFPELDHYRDRIDGNYWGPLFAQDIGVAPQWPVVSGPKIFAYLTPKISALTEVLDALTKVSGSKLVHIPNVDESLVARYSSAHLTIESKSMLMSEVLREASIVVHQGGLGVCSQALLAGVRQVLIPTQREQFMLAQRLSSNGLAYAVSPFAKSTDYQLSINSALNCQALGAQLKGFATIYQGFSQEEQLEAMCEEMVAL